MVQQHLPGMNLTISLIYKVRFKWGWILLVFICFWHSSPLLSQYLIFRSAYDSIGIGGVFIYQQKSGKNTLTDHNGRANLSIFIKGEEVLTQHPSYQPKSLTVENGDSIIYIKTKTLEIAEITINSSRWVENTEESTSKQVSLSKEDISQIDHQTVPDVLSNSGQVYVQKSQLGGGSPMIRGFSANSILLAIDGVRINNAIYRGGNLQNSINIDPNILGNIEIYYGPGSVIFGSDALGGVLNFTTIKEIDLNQEKLVKFDFKNQYSSANNGSSHHVKTIYKHKKLLSISSFSYSGLGDLRTGKSRDSRFPEFGKRNWYQATIHNTDTVQKNSKPHIQIGSGYKAFYGLQKLRYQIKKSYAIEYMFYGATTSDIPRYDRLTLETRSFVPRYAEWYYGPQTLLFNTLRFRSNFKTRLYDSLKITLTGQNYKESRHSRLYQNDLMSNRAEDVSMYVFNIDTRKVISGTTNLFYGYELVSNEVKSTAHIKNIRSEIQLRESTRYPDGGSRQTSNALYIKANSSFLDKIYVNGGLRMETLRSKSIFKDKSFYDFPFDEINLMNRSLAWSLGARYNINTHLVSKWKTARGFRSPNIDDLSKVFDSEPGNIVIPNPGLRAEKALSNEFSISYNTGNMNLDLNLYLVSLKDAIVRRDARFNNEDSIVFEGVMSKVKSNINASSAYVYGFGIIADFKITDALMLNNTFSYNNGSDDAGEPLRHTSPFFGKSSITYTKRKYRVSAFTLYNGKRKFEDLAPSERDKPEFYTKAGSLAWYTLNLGFSYLLFDKSRVSINVNNLLDRNYRGYASGIDAPGRNFVFTLYSTF